MSRNRPVTTPRLPEVRPGIVELLDLALLYLEYRIIHGSSVYARRSAGLESSNGETRLLELFSEVSCGSFSCSTAGQMCLGANVDPTAQKRSGSDYYASRAETSPLERYDTEYTPFIRVKDESGNGPLYCLQIGLLFEKRSDRTPRDQYRRWSSKQSFPTASPYAIVGAN